jgi:small subunit ribosomal protein S17
MPKKVLTGKVVSNKMTKTVVVAVEMPKRHPLYGKVIKNTRRFKAHAENPLNEGDLVVIEECKPYGKEVTWRVVEG